MRYLVLAADYDGTLAAHCRVDEPTLEALPELRCSERRLILVSGRAWEDLKGIFSQSSKPTTVNKLARATGAVGNFRVSCTDATCPRDEARRHPL